MKKGFTLIELLAVIVLLAIIALIATPIIINIIEDSKEQSAINSAQLYVDGLQKKIVSENIIEEFNPSSCTITNDSVSCGGTNLDYNVTGDKPTSGTITIDNGVATGYTLIINGYTVTKSGAAVTIAKGTTEPTPTSVLNCPGPNCVYSISNVDEYAHYVHIGDNAGTLNTDYFTDYTLLESSDWFEPNVFLGYILNNNGEISEAYVCGIYSDDLFCLRAGVDESALTDKPVFTANSGVTTEIFGSATCDSEHLCGTTCASAPHNEPDSKYLSAEFYDSGNVVVTPDAIYGMKASAQCYSDTTGLACEYSPSMCIIDPIITVDIDE